MNTTTLTQNQVCECEHVAHTTRGRLTPNGNPGHAFGIKFHPSYMTRVLTVYGVHNVCRDCANDCLQHNPRR